jgi:hypothetical protein
MQRGSWSVAARYGLSVWVYRLDRLVRVRKCISGVAQLPRVEGSLKLRAGFTLKDLLPFASMRRACHHEMLVSVPESGLNTARRSND